jgi:hypothetical protein
MHTTVQIESQAKAPTILPNPMVSDDGGDLTNVQHKTI